MRRKILETAVELDYTSKRAQKRTKKLCILIENTDYQTPNQFGHDMGIHIPRDISIVGFDDLPMAAYTTPALTTIRQDRIGLGKCGYYAVSCLLNNLSIASIQLRASLIVRDSTGPVKTED